jgi:hypothetical protein
VLEAANRFRDALIAASSRAAPARCFPKSHRPFIPRAGSGQIILGKVGDLAVRSSPLGSPIWRSRQYLVPPCAQ